MQLKHFITLMWRLLRVQTYYLLGLHVLLGFLSSFLAGGNQLPAEIIHTITGIKLLVGLTLPALWYMFGAGLNDLADEHIDKVNLKDSKERTLVSGEATQSELKVVLAVVAAFVIALTLVLGTRMVILSALILILAWAYSFPPIRISYRGIWAPLLLPLGYVAYPFCVGASVMGWNYDRYSLLLGVGLYSLFVSRVMLKDFRDVVGDRKFGKRTFLLRHNAKFVTTCSWIAFSLSIIVLGYVVRHAGAVTVAVLIVLFGCGTWLFIDLRQLEHWKEQKVILPFLSRIKSLVAAELIIYFLYRTSEISYLEYATVSILLLITVWPTVISPYHRPSIDSHAN